MVLQENGAWYYFHPPAPILVHLLVIKSRLKRNFCTQEKPPTVEQSLPLPEYRQFATENANHSLDLTWLSEGASFSTSLNRRHSGEKDNNVKKTLRVFPCSRIAGSLQTKEQLLEVQTAKKWDDSVCKTHGVCLPNVSELGSTHLSARLQNYVVFLETGKRICKTVAPRRLLVVVCVRDSRGRDSATASKWDSICVWSLETSQRPIVRFNTTEELRQCSSTDCNLT